MASVKEKQAAARELVAGNEGYNKGRRTSFFNHKTGALVRGRAGDCSETCGWIAYRGGYLTLKTILGVFYTGNAIGKYTAAGYDAIAFHSLSQVRAGDFLITPGHHMVFALTAKTFVSWEWDERGKGSGGKDGIQKGEKVGLRAAYVRPGGWDYILRPRSVATWQGRALAAFAQGKSTSRARSVLKARATHDGPLWSKFLDHWTAVNKGLSFAAADTLTVPAGARHAFVVLGTKLADEGKLTGKFVRRLQLALTGLKAHPSSVVVVTGGKPENGITEAAAGAAWLKAHGISDDRIILEDGSDNTIENAANTLPLLRAKLITSYTLVSDASHLRRATMLFAAAQLKIECAENVSLNLAATKPVPFNDYAPKAVVTAGAIAADDRATIASEVASLLGLASQYKAAL